MIKGSGIDIVEIKKLERAVKRWGDVFLKRVFTDIELAYSRKKRYPMQHLAARFAAKEAIFKAYGTNPKLNFKDIEISNDRYGRPFCIINKKKPQILLSLSHTDNYAVASAIIT
ncbi:MAG TPA: holo-ACP synthase [Candidatus Omnitrophota bacterium]|nr:holo-ACP synthase [Candidatus Omnitrophota bacterium]